MELALFIYLAETICTKGGESGYAFLLGIFFVLYSSNYSEPG